MLHGKPAGQRKMAKPTSQRRLAAIMVADVVGYSRMIANDELGTLQRWQERCERIIQPSVSNNGGRIVKYLGDGFLGEFPSSVAAVECAVAIQQEFQRENVQGLTTQALTLRVGVNIGDVVRQGNDIL
jgi:adenylate cyclase